MSKISIETSEEPMSALPLEGLIDLADRLVHFQIIAVGCPNVPARAFVPAQLVVGRQCVMTAEDRAGLRSGSSGVCCFAPDSIRIGSPAAPSFAASMRGAAQTHKSPRQKCFSPETAEMDSTWGVRQDFVIR